VTEHARKENCRRVWIRSSPKFLGSVARDFPVSWGTGGNDAFLWSPANKLDPSSEYSGTNGQQFREVFLRGQNFFGYQPSEAIFFGLEVNCVGCTARTATCGSTTGAMSRLRFTRLATM
jgi:hypothetical protein